MFPQAAQTTVHLPECLGHEIYLPEERGCYGQVYVNMGYYPKAMSLIRNRINTFTSVLNRQWGAIVAPSGSCTGSLQYQTPFVARDQGEPRLTVYAGTPAKKTYDLPELFVNVLGMVDVGAYFPHRVMHHTACHLLRMIRISDAAIRLITTARGVDYVPPSDSDIYCGFGGTFSLKNPEVSVTTLPGKVVNVTPTGVEIVVADDYSCLTSIGGGLARSGSGIRSVYLAEVLAGIEESPWFVFAANMKVGA